MPQPHPEETTAQKTSEHGAPLGVSDHTTRPFDPGASDAEAANACWWVTVVWHPDIRCVGAVAHIADSGDSLVLGRGVPVFTRPDGERVVLSDPHISRRALTVSPAPDCGGLAAWECERPAGSSRLRCEGRDLRDSQQMSEQQWSEGVTFTLADHVLIHVRRAVSPDAFQAVTSIPGLLGVSPAMDALRVALDDAAATGDDVLLIGPTGCGKEVVARALHARSSTPGAAWVAVNMAAIPSELAAASLFGARRGAYTGADANRPGFFQQAAGGTLFLDEIGDAPAALQPLLLRVLQERQVQVVGGAIEAVDVRVVSAMERDPDSSEFPFRGALRHRLAAQELHMPTLSQRREDVGLLLVTFIGAAARPGDRFWPPTTVDSPRWLRLLELCMAHSWPGNVRELQQAAKQIAAASRRRGLIVPPVLLRRLRASADRVDAPMDRGVVEPGTVPVVVSEACTDSDRRAALRSGAPDPGSDGRRLADLDDDALFEQWLAADCEIAKLARRLGVSRSTVYRRVEKSRRCRLAADVPFTELFDALDACRGDLEATAECLAVSRRGLEARMRASGSNTPQDSVPEAG